MKKILSSFILLMCLYNSTSAQVKVEDIPGMLDQLLGKAKLLSVKKGFNPVFKLGDIQINKVGLFGEKLKGIKVLGEIFDKKRIDQVNKLYKTYKTGLVVYKVLAATGTAITVISTVKGITAEENFSDATVKKMLYPAIASIATGVITKILTKKASYKAVDLFNGVVKKTIKDIFSVAPASSNIGVGLYVKL